MNYRHIYHAGTACDVIKHATLVLLVAALRAKDKGFAVLDTHAGIGVYDLQAPEAQATGEADAGIRRVLAFFDKQEPPDDLALYLGEIRDINAQRGAAGLRYYPGSPALVRGLLRAQDRLMACEAHIEDAKLLRRCFHADKQVQIHRRDGYDALSSLLPPPERRGLVFMDPPFEVPGEFDRLANSASFLRQKWRDGHMALWYPIKERPAIWRFHEALRATGLPVLIAEFLFLPENRADRLNGSGLALVNPPWKIADKIKPLYAALHPALQTESQESPLFWLNEPP